MFLTAKTDDITKVEGFQLGIDDFIDKPFSNEVLKTRIHALIQNRKDLKAQLGGMKNELPKNQISKRDLAFWNSLNEIIAQRYAESSFTTEELSSALHMSRSTFYRKFKGFSGKNASDYIRDFRLTKAAELINSKDYPISEVALMVGFESNSQFRTNFKEKFGVNPSQYIKSN